MWVVSVMVMVLAIVVVIVGMVTILGVDAGHCHDGGGGYTINTGGIVTIPRLHHQCWLPS